MNNKKIKKQTGNIIVVEKINNKEVRTHARNLRKKHNKFSNKDFMFFTKNESVVKHVKFDMHLFGEEFKHPFTINEENNIKEMVAIYYIVNGVAKDAIYLFEIND